MVTLLAFLVALGVLITFHELGHYWVARLCGVKIKTFSFGFGPKLWSKRLGPDQTEWCISALPLGGYVAMLDEREGEVDPAERHRAFNTQSVFKRIAIVAAGPIANLLLAVFLFAFMAWMGQPEIAPVTSQPVAHSQAAAHGIKPLDKVVSVAGNDIEGLEDFSWTLLENAGQSRVPITFMRDGARFTADFDLSTLKLEEDAASPFEQIGIRFHYGDPWFVDVEPGSAADAAGVKAGDAVLAADGIYGLSVQELITRISTSGANGVRLTLEDEKGYVRDVHVVARVQTVDDGQGGQVTKPVIGVRVGIKPDIIWIKKGPIEGVVSGVERMASITKTTYVAIKSMLVGEASTKTISGPITIADYAGKSAQMGWRVYLSFLAMISVSLGLLNLLPIPLLDGGHLLYYLVEIVRGRPVSDKWMQAGQKLGLLIVLALTALALTNDLLRLLE